jgi:phage regulator Rha-like protein
MTDTANPRRKIPPVLRSSVIADSLMVARAFGKRHGRVAIKVAYIQAFNTMEAMLGRRPFDPTDFTSR